MKKRTGLLVISGVLGFGLILALLVLFAVRFMRERALIYEIPGGYTGWIFIQFDDAACPPLSRRGEPRVIKISPTGRACTSSAFMMGKIHYVQFEYVYGDGRHVRLKASSSSGGDAMVRTLTSSLEDRWEIHFVGNKDEFMHAGPLPYPWRNSGNSNK